MSERRTYFKEKFDICELSLKPNFDKDQIMKKYRIRKSCLSIVKEKTHFFETMIYTYYIL